MNDSAPTPLRVESAGDPTHPLMVLVHGAMDRSAGMLRLSRRLDHDHHVVRYDRRGYGRSTPHPGPFHIDAHVDDLLAILAGRPAFLVGHSFGGNIVLALAHRHPELAVGVVVYEAPRSWEPWWPSSSAAAMAEEAALDPAEGAEHFMRRVVGRARWEALPERTREARRAEGVPLREELTSIRHRAPWIDGEISVPVMLGVGGKAREHHVRAMETAAAGIPNARLVVLPDCGHMANQTHPDLFREALIDPLLAPR